MQSKPGFLKEKLGHWMSKSFNATPFLPCPISRNARPCRAGLTEYVITHGIAENPFGVTSSAANAADASPANAHDGKMPAGVGTRSSASEESGYSPSRDQNIQRLRAFT